MFQLSLFKRKTAEQALVKLEGMLADLKQRELFDEEQAKGSK